MGFLKRHWLALFGFAFLVIWLAPRVLRVDTSTRKDAALECGDKCEELHGGEARAQLHAAESSAPPTSHSSEATAKPDSTPPARTLNLKPCTAGDWDVVRKQNEGLVRDTNPPCLVLGALTHVRLNDGTVVWPGLDVACNADCQQERRSIEEEWANHVKSLREIVNRQFK